MPELLNLLAIPIMWTLSVLWAMGVYVATEPGMALFKLDQALRESAPWWIYKPLTVCPPCMAGSQSIPLYILFCWFTPFEYNLFFQLLISVPCIFITRVVLDKYEPNTDLYPA